MKRLLPLIQFFPISIFIGIARSHGFTSESWSVAFQWGAIAAILEMIVLLPILGNRLSRLIAGANLFLILGGAGFFFNIAPLMDLTGILREAGVLFSVLLVCILSFFTTPTGVFEKIHSKSGAEKKYSVIFLVGVVAAIAWSLNHRGDTIFGAVIPFVGLIILKQALQKRMATI